MRMTTFNVVIRQAFRSQPSNNVMYSKKNLDITNQFLQSLGTSFNLGSTVLLKQVFKMSPDTPRPSPALSSCAS